MGNSHTSALGATTTARQVIEHYSVDLRGRTAIVTGGNSGIGLETCKALASAGARVVLCSRSVANGTSAVAEEILVAGKSGYSVPEAEVVVKEIDLASLSSVRKLAEVYAVF